MSEPLNISFDERELEIIRKTAENLDMRPETVVKRWTRLGQMLDKHMTEQPDTTVGYLDDQGDFHSFFDYGPKMAPMPAPTCSACEKSQRREWTEPEEHTCGLEQNAAAWENEGGA